jgi:hypothetical protein
LRLPGPIDWVFRNRKTGRITIAQFPNVPLGLFLAASVLRRLLDPSGGLDTGLKVVATGGLIWWAADEVIRGVNPWRRLLGGFVLAGQVVNLVGG